MRRSGWLSLAAAGPAVVIVLIEAASLLLATGGRHPQWPDRQLNLAEAVAVRDTAEVIRLLEAGEDPSTRRRVRPGLMGNDVEVAAMPLEAAVSIGRTELIGLLFDRGARLTQEEWASLRCAARALEDDAVLAALDGRRPVPGGAVACSGEEQWWRPGLSLP